MNNIHDAFDDSKEKLTPSDDKNRNKDPQQDGGSAEDPSAATCVDCESAEEAEADVITGLEAFATPRGLMEFTIGVMNGTSLIVEESDMLTCSDSIVIEIIENAYIFYNETTSGSPFIGLYAMYDMVAALHPTVFYCRKTIMDAYYGAAVHFDTLDDIRRIIDNFVHNFSYMMDAILDVSSFFNSGDRGQHIDGPYDAGFGVGMLIFYLVADDTSTLMVDPAKDAELPLKFEWGENITRWKEENRIRREEKERQKAEELAKAEAAAAAEENGEPKETDF